MENRIKIAKNGLCLIVVLSLFNCGTHRNEKKRDTGVSFWLTKSDESVLLEKQEPSLVFDTVPNFHSSVEIDDTQRYQSIDGFGFSLTGGSAMVINRLGKSKKEALLQELFGISNDHEIGISYLRISIGASDLNETVFSYDDLPIGEQDLKLQHFNFGPDAVDLIPLLKEILVINPKLKIMATPWSAPRWMKDNNNFVGGSLKPEYYGVYVQYFVKYIQKMKAEGICIDAITPQNEPLHPGNNPSMLMLAEQQSEFIKNHLGPAFKAFQLNTKIVIYDHNCNKPEYPIAILKDDAASRFIDGSAFHLYEGDISALSKVHGLFPNKNVYFTEQYTASSGSFEGDLKWHVKNVIIGSMRNWSKTALEWNLANNALFGPYTPGGCNICKGALTISDSGNVARNVGYYIIAHASKFVRPGSVRIASSIVGNLNNVAFITPNGKRVLIVENDGQATEVFNIKYHGSWVKTSLESGSVGTYIW